MPFHFSGDNPLNTTSNEEWETALKYLMKHSNKQFEEQNSSEEWLRLQELRKQSLVNGLRLNQMNMFNSKSGYIVSMEELVLIFIN